MTGIETPDPPAATARAGSGSLSSPESDPADPIESRNVVSISRRLDERFDVDDIDAPASGDASATDRPTPAADPVVASSRGDSSGADSSSMVEPAMRSSSGTVRPAVETRPGGTRFVELPLERLAAAGFVTPDVTKSRLTEEFRRVKRPILRRMAGEATAGGHPNIIMVTSSVTGEGKTYTAINLAMSLAAERERTVLLVDADVIKGSAGMELGIDRERPGLTDLLNGDLELHDVILGTDVPDLRFLPAGTPNDDATELLSSERMRRVVDELAERYADRIVLLDCPPMLQTNEANVIAEYAGQVVFVVAGEETAQRLVVEALGHFDEEKPVGVLLNKASNVASRYGYGGYGYDDD